MRLDRLITLGCVNPWLGWWPKLLPIDSVAPRRSLPVLMYHSVSQDLEVGVAPYFRTSVEPSRFAEQMQFLRSEGWRAVTLRDGIRDLASAPVRSREKLVVLTFDDGFRDFSQAAMPVLNGLDFRATMFLPTAFVSPTDECLRFAGRNCMTWREISHLHAVGIEFGSHSRSHPRLVNLTWPAIKAEIFDSKAAIEQRLGGKVTSFSYPYAFPQAEREFAARFQSLLVEAGYDMCVTTEIGRMGVGDNPYRIRRLPVNQADDLPLFRAKLLGGYDWVSGPQRILKTWKRAFLPSRRTAS